MSTIPPKMSSRTRSVRSWRLSAYKVCILRHMWSMWRSIIRDGIITMVRCSAVGDGAVMRCAMCCVLWMNRRRAHRGGVAANSRRAKTRVRRRYTFIEERAGGGVENTTRCVVLLASRDNTIKYDVTRTSRDDSRARVLLVAPRGLRRP